MREFARIDDVKEGDTVVADRGFSCLISGKKYIVHNDETAPRGLHVRCSEGKHFLVGQIDKSETHYVGLYKAE